MWSKTDSHLQNGAASLEDSLADLSHQAEHTLDQATVIFGIYPRELVTYVHTKPAHDALFIIAKT